MNWQGGSALVAQYNLGTVYVVRAISILSLWYPSVCYKVNNNFSCTSIINQANIEHTTRIIIIILGGLILRLRLTK